MSMMITKIPPALLAGAVLVALLPTQATARDVLDRFDFGVSGGYRVDQLDWNIAGNIEGNSPDVLSELTWHDLKSNQVSARGKMIITNAQVSVAGAIRVGGNYGEINSGENQDSDYNGDGRTREFLRSTAIADSGAVWDGNLGGGVVFFNQARTFAVTPMVGYSLHRQNLTMREGNLVLSEQANAPEDFTLPATGPFADLNSTYETRWHSGWLGLDLDYIPTPHFDLHGAVELHAGKYQADANWNLRGDFAHPVSFRHSSDQANGIVANIGMRAGVRNVLLTLDVNYQRWRAKDGEDQTYAWNGASGITKLNEVNWEASSINAGMTVSF